MKKISYSILVLGLSVAALIFNLSNQDETEFVSALDYDEPKKADKPELSIALYDELTTKPGQPNAYPIGYRFKELEKAKREFSAFRGESSYEFIERGPANVPGRTRGLVVDPDDPAKQTWFAGGVGGGIWKTTDGGQSWQDQTPDIPNLAISWIVMAELNHDILYAGTGEGWGGSSNFIKGNGILKSIDRGETWLPLTSTTENTAFEIVNRIIVDPANPDILLAATSTDRRYNREPESAIYKSIDGGLSWEKKYTSDTYVQQIITDPDDFSIQYAAEYGIGVLKSVDAGETWAPSSTGMTVAGRLELAVSPVNPVRLFASAQGDITGTGSDLFFSNDSGATWNIAVNESGEQIDFLGGQGWYDNTIVAHPFNFDEVYVGGVDFWKFKVSNQNIDLGNMFVGADEENIDNFFDLNGFNNGDVYQSKIALGELDPDEFFSVEIRFGPDGEGDILKQMAHRFEVPLGQGSGVPDSDYSYADYVEVPFQVWDIKNDQQLMIAFRDQQRDGIYNLLEFNADNEQWQDNSREYLYISNVPYDPASPNSNMAQDGGHVFGNLYFMWPFLPPNGNWNPANFPESLFRINYKNLAGLSTEYTSIADAYSRHSGPNNFSQTTGSSTISGVHPDHHNIIPIIHNEADKQFKLVIANDGGIYSSSIGSNPGEVDGTWSFAGSSYNTSQFYAVDKAPGESRYVGGLQDNGTWMTSPGQEGSVTARYRRVNGGDGFGTAWNYERPDEILSTLYYNRIEKSTDQGRNSSSSTSGLSDVGAGLGPFVTELEYYHADPDVVYTVGLKGVWKSEDFGDSWSLAPITTNWVLRSTMFARISLANPNIVWAGTGMTEDRAFHVSVDAGISFQETNNVPGEWFRASGFATHPVLDSTAFVLFSYAKSPKILRTDDLGQTWNDISGFESEISSKGFPDVSVRDFLVMPNDTSVFWAATEIGIFESTDAGASWHMLPGNLPAIPVWDLKIVDKEVVAGSHGRGIWSVELPDLTGHVYIPEIISVIPTKAGEPVFLVEAKSAYDSAILYVNNQRLEKIEAVNQGVINISGAGTAEQTGTAYLRAYRDGRPFVSKRYNYTVSGFAEAVESYDNNFDNGAATDFVGTGFSVRAEQGFEGRAIHSEHDYVSKAQYFYILKQPIKVRESNALINFLEIALVEPGEDNALPGSVEFKDYVVVQGSLDGENWLNLLDPYDASSKPRWEASFVPFAEGNPEMIFFRSIDLQETFNTGDEVIIRFFLEADEETEGWGWMIDNLQIQTESVITSIDESNIKTGFAVYPNPVTGNVISLVNQNEIKVADIQLINASGQVELQKTINTGATNEITLPENIGNGIYILMIESKAGRETHKLLIDR